MKRSFWALGDMHGNGRGLRSALARVDSSPRDELVLMGDLLTYGMDVAEVVDCVAERVAAGAHLLLGNHDQLYLELLKDESGYYDTMPGWIQECADHTLPLLASTGFDTLPFVHELVLEGVYFAHANPFGDWTYLNRRADQTRAADVVASLGCSVAVFGHTHRSRIVEFPGALGWDDDERRELQRCMASGEVLLLNTGSVGQPRNRSCAATLLSLDMDGPKVDASIIDLDWDVAGHLEALARAPLSPETIAKLVRFFEPRA
jgi:predicted phosphodiesterase